MNDKNIPPPNISFNRKAFTELAEDSLIDDNFNDYLRESNDKRSKKKKQEREEDDRRLQSKRKSSMAYEELQQNARKQAEQNKKSTLDELDFQEGDLEEFEQELDKQNQATKKESKELRQKGDKENILEAKKQVKEESHDTKAAKGTKGQSGEAKQTEENQMKSIQDNQEVLENGEDVETLTEEDPLKKMRQDLKSEKEASKTSKKENNDTEKLKDEKSTDKSKKKDRGEKGEGTTVKQGRVAEAKKMDIDPTLAHLVKGEVEAEKGAQLTQTSQSKSAEAKSEQLKEFEEMAMQIISEAHVLEDGDVIETTVQINSQNPQFDKGEVTVTAYKYRPLEVNLKFANFNPDATKLMIKKKNDLKKGLQTKSLKVHQLDIIE